MTSRLRIGYVQTDPVFGRKQENLDRALEQIDGVQADLLVLPELFQTGYEFRSPAEAAELAEEVPAGPTSERIQEHCRKRGLHLVFGIAERAGDRIFNSAVLFGPDGHRGTYRKIHLFDREKKLFQRGDLGFLTFPVLDTRIGLMVCFDWIFPESARTLALRGTRILCHPANLVLPYCPRAMPTRCLENRIFAVTANRVGQEDRAGRELRFIGQSQITAPDGSILASAPADAEEVAVVEIDPSQAESKRIGGENDLFADRWPDVYQVDSPDQLM